MRILVAVDSSEPARNAVCEVARRPWPAHTEIRLLSIVEPMDFAASEVYAPDFFEATTNAAREAIQPLAVELARPGHKVTSVVVPGYPRIDIAVQARQFRADLILMGSRGLGTLGRFFLGSVAQAVVRDAPCSVEVVRKSGGDRLRVGGMRLLLATDGSRYSHEAARAIVGRPWPKGSELRVVCVPERVHSSAHWVVKPVEWKRLVELNREAAEDAVAGTRRLVERCPLSVTTDLLEGEPKSALVDECERWDADLIFVGSHGRRGLEWLLLGSVSEAVVTHARCSVELVREAMAGGP
jgi:nucleotide-binding universal stress UspA family protein